MWLPTEFQTPFYMFWFDMRHLYLSENKVWVWHRRIFRSGNIWQISGLLWIDMIVRRSSAGRILHFPAQQPTPDSKCSPGGQLGIYSSGQMAVAEIFKKYQISITCYISTWNVSVLHQDGGNIGKSFPDGWKISRDPGDFPRAKAWEVSRVEGNLERFPKVVGFAATL